MTRITMKKNDMMKRGGGLLGRTMSMRILRSTTPLVLIKGLSLFLLLLLSVVRLQAQETPEGLYINKSYEPSSGDGSRGTITLEAFVTGGYVTAEHVPTDIVMVMDQSTTMAYNFQGTDLNSFERLNALKAAARTFVDIVYQDAIDAGVDHRIAIVGFGSGRQASNGNWYWEGTDLISTVSPKSYGNLQGQCQLTVDDYREALVPVIGSNGVNARLTTAIGALYARGQTMMNYGLEMAQSVFDNRITTTYQYEGQWLDRQ